MKYKKPPWIVLGNRMRMGLKSLKDNEWLPFDDAYGPDGERKNQMEIKKILRKEKHEKIFMSLPETVDSGSEVLQLIKTHFKISNKLIPFIKFNKQLHPLDYAGRLVPEDLLLLKKKKNNWILAAGSLYFPAHWKLSDKISKKLTSIHDPVPHYKDVLEKAMDKFFENMIVGPITTRRNWTIQIGNDLYVPERKWETNLKSHEVPKKVYIREEYQTLRKTPLTNSVLFSIRTHLWPLSTWAKEKEALI